MTAVIQVDCVRCGRTADDRETSAYLSDPDPRPGPWDCGGCCRMCDPWPACSCCQWCDGTGGDLTGPCKRCKGAGYL